jgi:hypothetical protein
MNTYTTKIKAICPITNELTTFFGPNVQGITPYFAQEYLNNNYLGYCKVDELLYAEIDETTNEITYYNSYRLN